MSDTTTTVDAYLDDARDVIIDLIEARSAATGSIDYTADVILVAQSLLAVVEKVLARHSPIRAYWCRECTTLHPCTTRREIIAALLGETVDD